MSRLRSFSVLSELLLEQGSATFPQCRANIQTHVLVIKLVPAGLRMQTMVMWGSNEVEGKRGVLLSLTEEEVVTD